MPALGRSSYDAIYVHSLELIYIQLEDYGGDDDLEDLLQRHSLRDIGKFLISANLNNTHAILDQVLILPH